MTKRTHDKQPLRHASELLPSDEAALRILKARSLQLSKKPLELGNVDHDDFYIAINIGDKNNFGIPYQFTREVLPITPITQIPYVPDFISGVINHRGALISIVDLKKLFALETRVSKAKYIIVTAAHDIMIGILVDNINGNVQYDPNNIAAPLTASPTIKSEYILGLHDNRIPLLNFEKIFEDVKSQLITQSSQ